MSHLRRENGRLRTERDIPKNGRGLVREGERIDPRRGYTFMKAHRAEFSLRAMCRVLGLSSSGYYIVDLMDGDRGAYWEGGGGGVAQALDKPVGYIMHQAAFDETEAHFDTNH